MAERPQQSVVDSQHLPSASSSSSTVSFHPAPCLLPLLQPIRSSFHPFVSSADAARLMQTSRCTTTSLLDGYGFHDHAFLFHTAAEMKRADALYSQYGTRILRIGLARDWTEPLLDSDSGRSILPASLLALCIGQQWDSDTETWTLRDCAATAAFDGAERLEAEAAGEEKDGDRDDESYFRRRIRPVNGCFTEADTDDSWNVAQFRRAGADLFNQPLPAGALPHGLRYLQLNREFYQPLDVGSIPDTVEVLQFGELYNLPLTAGQLPASLTHLVCSFFYDHSLEPGVFPAGLRRLSLPGMWKQPLRPGLLPPQLRQLSFGLFFKQPITPGAIPPSVTHIRLSPGCEHRLLVGSIPHGVRHLNLGTGFNRPLLPGVLPSSLRELIFGASYTQPLQPGSLPDGLEVLAFHCDSEYPHALLPGIIPASVVVMSLGNSDDDTRELVPSGIPATVRWLRLNRNYATRKHSGQELSAVLSPSTRVVWWQPPQTTRTMRF